MKKLLLSLLLFPLLCLGQSYGNYTKVTAIRMVNPHREGYTTLKGFVEEGDRIGARIQGVQEEDEALAFALIALKKQAKDWQKKSLPMYVVQINRFRDTIYTTEGNASIYFPDEEMEYMDPGNFINGALTEKLCFLAERNFKGEFLTHQNDSLPVSQLLLNGKGIYGHTRKGFEKNLQKFDRVATDSIFGKKKISVDKTFWINNYVMKFEKKLSNFTAMVLPGADYPQKAVFTAGGIQLEDSEEKLALAFPCSLEYRNWGASPYNMGDNYYYTVHLTENKGYVLFYIKNKKVDKIEVEFR
jgi:hypothetical protein